MLQCICSHGNCIKILLLLFFFFNESMLSDYSHKLQTTHLEQGQMQRREHMLREKLKGNIEAQIKYAITSEPLS